MTFFFLHVPVATRLPGGLQIYFGVRLLILSIIFLSETHSLIIVYSTTPRKKVEITAEDNDTGNCEMPLWNNYAELLPTWSTAFHIVAQLDVKWDFDPTTPFLLWIGVEWGNLITSRCGWEVHCCDWNPHILYLTESAFHNGHLSRWKLILIKSDCARPRRERAAEAPNTHNGKRRNLERARPTSIHRQA